MEKAEKELERRSKFLNSLIQNKKKSIKQPQQQEQEKKFCGDTCTQNKNFMDCSNKTVDCGGSSGHEFIEVDKFQDDDTSWEPTKDMCFSSADDVKSFYREYALRKGFGWKIRTSRKGDDGELCYLMLSVVELKLV
ncbi:unnamed protein product [Trifolium pratense]|uniref:Uncharacterized protein n=1 Tax=Trifolium pratense TaxID=57577 RepID=A0ACB0LZ06_TRIPR|nr:unnamed protein product [Trifolium pratense]